MNLWLLIPGMAILNRASGMTEWFPGRNIYATSILAGIFGWYLIGWPFGLAMFLSMVTYRILGWYKMLDIGSDEGSPIGEFFGMWVRSLLFAPAFVYAYMTGTPLAVAVGTWVAMGLGCALSYTIGMWVKHGFDKGLVSEVLAGLCIGTALFLALTLKG